MLAKKYRLDCEARATTQEYRRFIKECSSERKNQRLELFNRRFWEVFSVSKDIPRNPTKGLMDKAKLLEIAKHCHKRWNCEDILNVTARIVEESKTDSAIAFNVNRFSGYGLLPEQEMVEIMKASFSGIDSPLNKVIREEVIRWLGTDSAFVSFVKLIALAAYDLAEVEPPPWHTTKISYMAIASLALTDWDKSIKQVEGTKESTRGKGFGNK